MALLLCLPFKTFDVLGTAHSPLLFFFFFIKCSNIGYVICIQLIPLPFSRLSISSYLMSLTPQTYFTNLERKFLALNFLALNLLYYLLTWEVIFAIVFWDVAHLYVFFSPLYFLPYYIYGSFSWFFLTLF